MRQKIKLLFLFFFHEIFYSSSWVIFYIFLALAFYEKEINSFNNKYDNLFNEYENFKIEYLSAKEINEDLKLQINSLSDPDWIELILMKNLGVIPQGYEKMMIIDNLNGK